MTTAEKADKEMEVIAWMNKKGYDRKASKDIAPIIVKYLEEVEKNINSKKNVRGAGCPKQQIHNFFKLQGYNYCDECGEEL